MRQQPPGAASAAEVKDSVDDFPHVHLAVAATGQCRWNGMLKQRPLFVGKVRWVGRPCHRISYRLSDGFSHTLLGRIWQARTPASPDVKTDAHLVSLGVDINDIWLVAVAWEHGLAVVTTDKMRVIREAVGVDVAFENWHG